MDLLTLNDTKGVSSSIYALNANILSDKVLTDYMIHRNKKSLKDLKGKISFRDDYDYKSMRI